MTAPRRARIADQILRELAEIIRLDLRDPRVGMVTLTGIEVSGDQSHAKVFFTILGPESAALDAREGLQRAAGFLRTSIARRLSTRSVPELHFHHDESVERGMRLSKLIDEAVAPKPAPKRVARKAAPNAAESKAAPKAAAPKAKPAAAKPPRGRSTP
jgi:ribosome-binding factor A